VSLLLVSPQGATPAKVVLNNDASYTFTYVGTLTLGLALAAAAQGQLSAKDESDLKKEGGKLILEPGSNLWCTKAVAGTRCR